MAPVVKPYQGGLSSAPRQVTTVRASQSGVSEAARGMQQVGQLFYDFQDEVDTADAKVADAQFGKVIQDALYSDGSGYMFSTGGDSVARREGTLKDLEKARDQFIAGLSPAAASRANGAIQARYNQTAQSVNTHAATQGRQYLNDASSARIELYANDAVFRPDAAQLELSRADQEISDMAARNGWSPEVTELERRKVHTQVHSRIVQRIAQADAASALQYLQANRDGIDGNALVQLEGVLAPMVKEQRGRAMGAAAAGGGTSRVDFIMRKEGFKNTAYWDVNAWRTGYGSDTITRADGTVEAVSETSLISREDADRDIARRLGQEFEPSVKRAIGQQRWDGLTENQKTALTSLAYNYGAGAWGKGLATVRAAMQDGTDQDIAAAIAALGSHNDGINRERRNEEAALFLSPDTPGMTLENLLDIQDPTERNAAVTEFNLRTKVAADRQEAIVRQAQGNAFALIEAGGSSGSISVADRQSLGIEFMSKLRTYENKLATEGTIRTDDAKFAEWRIMAAQDPELFLRVDPADMRIDLNDADYKAMVTLQASIFDQQRSDLEGEEKAAAKAAADLADPTKQEIGISQVRTALDTAIDAAGLGPGTSSSSKKTAGQVKATLEAAALRWRDEFIKAEKRPPSTIEVNQKVRELTTSITVDPAGVGNKRTGVSATVNLDGEVVNQGGRIVRQKPVTAADMITASVKIGDVTVPPNDIQDFIEAYVTAFGYEPTGQEVMDGLIQSQRYFNEPL